MSTTTINTTRLQEQMIDQLRIQADGIRCLPYEDNPGCIYELFQELLATIDLAVTFNVPHDEIHTFIKAIVADYRAKQRAYNERMHQ